MNKIMRDYNPMFEEYQALRSKLMEVLDDPDLSFRPSAGNQTLGSLCREIGEIQVAYIRSFQTLKSDFSYRYEDAITLEGSVAELKTWYTELDSKLKAVVSELSDKDIETREVEHGGYNFSLQFQLNVYAEALIIKDNSHLATKQTHTAGQIAALRSAICR